MHLMYFTEQPMSAYPEQAGRDFGATALMFSNEHFDPVAGSRLYHEYLEHYRLAEDVGFDGIMLNEHHNAPFCMQAKCNVFASILAATTKRGRPRKTLIPDVEAIAADEVYTVNIKGAVDGMWDACLAAGFPTHATV